LKFNLKIVCIFLCFCIAMEGRCYSKTPSEAPSKQEGSASDSTDSNGPTLMLNYSKETFKKNPILAFAYFIPLISPALVNRETSVNNEQQEGIISYERTVTSNSFYVACEFELSGKGFHKNTFDSAGMIARNIGNFKEGEPLTNILNWIKFEGDGVGLIEVKGTITGSTRTVTEVDISFNSNGRKSPVTIGLYSVKPQNGQYKYENRYNEIIARVDTLTFKKSEENNPRMGIEVASIHKTTEEEGFWSKVKGLIANFFIKPLEVDKLGNDTMLNFGYAILKQKPAFTFPKAKNIKESKTVAIDNK